MIISSKNQFLKGQPLHRNKVWCLLLLLAALGGCGNKGDLYHPEEQVSLQAEQVIVQPSHHEIDLSL